MNSSPYPREMADRAAQRHFAQAAKNMILTGGPGQTAAAHGAGQQGEALSGRGPGSATAERAEKCPVRACARGICARRRGGRAASRTSGFPARPLSLFFVTIATRAMAADNEALIPIRMHEDPW